MKSFLTGIEPGNERAFEQAVKEFQQKYPLKNLQAINRDATAPNMVEIRHTAKHDLWMLAIEYGKQQEKQLNKEVITTHP